MAENLTQYFFLLFAKKRFIFRKLILADFGYGTWGTNRAGLQGDFDDNNVALSCFDYFGVITALWVFFRIG